VLDLQRDAPAAARFFPGGLRRRRFERGAGQRGDLACDPGKAQAVSPVGRHRDLENPVFALGLRLAQRRQRLDLETGKRQELRQIAGRALDGDEFREPVKRELHAKKCRNEKPAPSSRPPRTSNLTELSQESQVVLKKQPNVVDAVLEHGDALHAHAEGEAGDLFRIVADESKNRRIDHAGAEDFEPAGGFAHAARLSVLESAAAAADDALNVDLGARLGKRKKARPKADAGLALENLAEKMG